MANKREFKKSVEALSAALVDEMMISYYNVKDVDRQKISDAVATIITALEKAKVDTAVQFDKKTKDFENLAGYLKAKKEFSKEKYDKAIEAYNNALADALKAYNEAMPQAEKEANKKAAAKE